MKPPPGRLPVRGSAPAGAATIRRAGPDGRGCRHSRRRWGRPGSMSYPCAIGLTRYGTMRGRDEETGEFRGDSRSQNRRDALEVLALCEQLVALTPAQLAKLPVPEDLLPHIRDTKRITSHIAHKRQLAFLAKQVRREDEATLDAIRDALDEKGEASRREISAMHRVEAWRDRLLADGDVALAELLDAYPEADR